MNSRLRLVKDLLWFVALFGLVAGVFRIWFGLGATTNLSDAMPWGLWKVLNMIAGVALSTSGFTVGFLVYVLKLEQFKPLVKPAVLVAFLGYGCSCLALLFDIGLPQRFWHPFVMWNEHSFLFEVFWCVSLYFTVTAIELSPTILKRLGMEKLSAWLHRIAFGVVVVGISLSSLHHSSLGSLFLVTPLRLHPLWYSSFIPWFFIISAIGAGLMFIILVRIGYAYFFNPEPVFGKQAEAAAGEACQRSGVGNTSRSRTPGTEIKMLERLAIIAASILALYLLMKVIDLFSTGSISALLAGTWESWLFAFELFIAAILPVVVIAIPRTRRSPYGLGLAALSASLGLALNRVDVGIFGYFQDALVPYFPSLAEWAVSFAVVAAAALAFFVISENFPIFDDRWKRREESLGFFRYSFDRLSHVCNTVLTDSLQRRTIIAVFAIPLAWILLYPPYHQGSQAEYAIVPSTGLDPMRTVLLIDGNRDAIKTEFHHADHQKRLGGENSCSKCHHATMPNDHATPCSRCHRNMITATNIFDHEKHMSYLVKSEHLTGLHPTNRSCAFCHTKEQPKSAANAKECTECHKENMRIQEQLDEHLALASACSFQAAMHDRCITCHNREEAQHPDKNLSHCSNCHKSLQPSAGSAMQALRSARDVLAPK